MAKDYTKYEINDLRALAKARGINTSGLSKTVIISRLKSWDTRKAKGKVGAPGRKPSGKKKHTPGGRHYYKLTPTGNRKLTPKRKHVAKYTPGGHRYYQKGQRRESAKEHKTHHGRMSATKELLSHCGPRCFADDKHKYAICPYCTEKSCSCYPKCEGLQAAFNRGINPDLMEYYAEALKCNWLDNVNRAKTYSPILRSSRSSRRRSIPYSKDSVRKASATRKISQDRLFAEGQWVVGFKSENGFKIPWFGKVKHIAKNGNIKITPYESFDKELIEWILYAWENDYQDWTPDEIVKERPKFMVIPSDKKMKTPKTIQVNPRGFWKDHQVHFKPYSQKDANKYRREYTAKEIQKVINGLTALL